MTKRVDWPLEKGTYCLSYLSFCTSYSNVTCITTGLKTPTVITTVADRSQLDVWSRISQPTQQLVWHEVLGTVTNNNNDNNKHDDDNKEILINRELLVYTTARRAVKKEGKD